MSTAISDETILSSQEAHDLPWVQISEEPGIRSKTFWRDPRGMSYGGLLRLEPGAWIPRHAHRFAVHHMWVELGSCRVGDQTIGPGGYVHVPVGAEHGIDEVGPGGCTLFYLYLSSAEFD